MSQSPAASVTQLDHARTTAMLARDTPALQQLLDDRFVYTHSNALTDDKASFIAKIGDGTFTYRRIDRSNERAVFAGDACLLYADLDIGIEVGGTDRALRIRTLTVWSREAGEWRALAFHSTPVPAS